MVVARVVVVVVGFRVVLGLVVLMEVVVDSSSLPVCGRFFSVQYTKPSNTNIARMIKT